MKINELRNCTGCHACYSACPQESITMYRDNEGFLYPVVNKISCTKCKLCEKVCPIITQLQRIATSDSAAFAAINKNDKIRSESSSGGIFTAIAEKMTTMSGIVFGAKFTPDFSVIHSHTSNTDDIADFRGSKYVQSTIGNSYKECKDLLDSGKTVLFSGTPCQIGGLKAFLRKDYRNLITIDFICHGVPSPLLWEKYISFKSADNQRITKITFRDKSSGWENYSFTVNYADGNIYKQIFRSNEYMRLFLKDVSLRPSCYNCNFKGISRHSDITLGDFWGIRQELPSFNDNRGTSFIIVHTDKGKEIIAKLGNCMIQEISTEQGAKHNPSLTKSANCPASRSAFFADLRAENFNIKKLAAKYAADSFSVRLKKALNCALRKLSKILRKKK